jgi:hypothetical protein
MFFRRRKQEALSMPLEGALGPNGRLDEADALPMAEPEAICVNRDGQLLVSSASNVFRIRRWGEEPELWGNFDAPVSALSASEGGRVAVGLSGGRIVVRNASGEPLSGWTPRSSPRAVADCLFLSEDELAVVDHGYGREEPILSLAPWDPVARGQVIGISRSGEMRVIAAGLHCPMGIALGPNGALVLTELERARVVETSGRVVQAGYPAYLGRIRKIANGYGLACWSRRDPLIEFLKTEREFVARMKAKIDPRHWISPRVTPEFSHDFPIELGATRLFGEIKPWAPSFSYGLVIETDPALMPVASAHSRANGIRHAISDVVFWNGSLIAVSRASEEILRFGPAGNVHER